MTTGSTTEQATVPETVPETRGWRGIVLTMLLAVAALIAVLVVLFTISRDVRARRRDLADVVAPASAQLSELQRVLAMQMAVQRGRAPANSPTDDYSALLDEENALYARLRPLTSAIGADASAALDELHAHTNRWHDAVAENRVNLSLDSGDYAAALAAAGRLSAIIADNAARLRADIAEGEQLESRVIVSMVVLAAIGLGILFRLAGRLHGLVENERRLARLARVHRDEVEQINREKSAFIRGVTHDLKNPVGVIDAYGDLLEMGLPGQLNQEQAHMVERIRAAVREALRIINDVLELGRADSADLNLQEEDTDLGPLVASLVEDYRTAAQRAGVTLETSDVAEGARVRTDAARVREILGNLITNAAKHTPTGGRIRVSVVRGDGAGQASPSLAIRVVDTGPGIPEHLRDDIFREFVRGSDSSGSGIGLAISRRLARALGGDLVLAGSSSEGSTFELVLPARRQAPA